MARIYPLRAKSERHLALDAEYPVDNWPHCCEINGGTCPTPTACLRPEPADSRYNANGRRSLQMLAVVLLAAVAFVATLAFWIGALA